MCCYHHTAFRCDYITWISSILSKWNRLYLENSTANWTIDSIQFFSFWCRWLLWLYFCHVRYFFFRYFFAMVIFLKVTHFFISGVIHWEFMMGIQIHQTCWEIHIVVIPCHPVESLQATTSSFIFILIKGVLELDSNWNTMQQVRMYSKYCAIKKD